MSTAERQMQVRNFVRDVWNGRNYEAAADLYADNYLNPFGTGPSTRAEPIRRYHAAFPDLQVEIEELILAGDTRCGKDHTSGDRHWRAPGTSSDRAGDADVGR
jgi:hypothetical protein